MFISRDEIGYGKENAVVGGVNVTLTLQITSVGTDGKELGVGIVKEVLDAKTVERIKNRILERNWEDIENLITNADLNFGDER